MGIELRGDGRSDNWLHELCNPRRRGLLPLVHVTQAGAARQIIDSDAIHVRECRVFTREKLVYFFAFRPEYKHHADAIIDTQVDHFPAAFVLSSKNLPMPRRVFPFDSGAAFSGFFDRAMQTGASKFIRLEDYALLTDTSSVNAFIKNVFGNEKSYFRGEIASKILNSREERGQGIQSYLAIACVPADGRNEPDERANSIEVSFNESIKLSGNLEAIVLPDKLMQSPGGPNLQMRRKLEGLGVRPETYEWRSSTTPEAYRKKLREIVKRIVLKDG